MTTYYDKNSLVHRSHAIRSLSARPPLASACPLLVVRAPSALSAHRLHYGRAVCASSAHRLLTLRSPFARCPCAVRTICASFASCPLVLRAPSASCPHVFCTPSASCLRTVYELFARPLCTARRSPSLCCSFSQNQIKKDSK
ncbi:hypothetical protein DEO72_LG8g2222 [Vigna unguiculata]|uniref:Uncharacterized protein n=1 Tax=Vigna unguiculata TaxID=3917 RepID=A0A4D6MVR7_VIGUN|nr:hypothetical protein DEO72_LG8g2222 [Vigna unguiculata]